ncbi:MAG: response regulator transcription factor [Treponema sp.]|nr:response regulator transcription factor [Treponema sp.]
MNTLFIVDDHSIVRTGLKEWLETNTKWQVTQLFADGQSCLDFLSRISSSEHYVNEKPDIIIIDVQLINETGFTLAQTISQNYPDIKIVIYSMFDTNGFILQAKDCGASGYISKVASETEMAKCLEVVQAGGTYLEQKMIEAQLKLDSIITVFTKQEKRIFELILQGKDNKQIGDELFISLPAVQNYVSRIYDKAYVKSREELIQKYK